MSFSTVKDQEVPLRLLGNMLRRNRAPNGLLFWGPSGVGKSLAANEFAKALNCAEATGDACDACLPCRKIAHGNHPDLYSVAPVKKSRNIDVAAIDSIIELASLRPYESRRRVFMIHEADRMRGPAQNHLLKTLEEPLGESVFILITEYPHRLLPTIRSRCQRVRFGALRPETVESILLRDRNLTTEEARAVASLSQGQLSRAFDLVDSERRAAVLDVVKRLSVGESPLAVAEEFAKYLAEQKSQIEATMKAESNAEETAELSAEDRETYHEELTAQVEALSRRDIMEHIYLLETWYRDALVYSATGDAAHVLNRDQLALLDTSRGAPGTEKIEAIEKARLYLERFLNEERVFRDLFFVLAR